MIQKSKHPFRVLLLLLLSLFSMGELTAQEGLKTNSIFEKYGKEKGATMVVLSGKALYEHRLDRYQGITLVVDKDILHEIQYCLEADKKQARQIKEVISDGMITSGYYQLGEEDERVKRYILYKMGNDGTATLIYLEGGAESEELVNRLFIKKRQPTD